jgi:hypothetical protein
MAKRCTDKAGDKSNAGQILRKQLQYRTASRIGQGNFIDKLRT